MPNNDDHIDSVRHRLFTDTFIESYSHERILELISEFYLLYQATVCVVVVYFSTHFIPHRAYFICEYMYEYVYILF